MNIVNKSNDQQGTGGIVESPNPKLRAKDFKAIGDKPGKINKKENSMKESGPA